MNRVIKFRAWAFHKMQDHFEALRLMANEAIPNNVRHVIMQFTGLMDNDGKAIFEGDIISVPEFYETPEMTSTVYINWLVVFKHGAFHLENKQHPAESDSDTLYREYEGYDGRFYIIGNIYENPELLSN